MKHPIIITSNGELTTRTKLGTILMSSILKAISAAVALQTSGSDNFILVSPKQYKKIKKTIKKTINKDFLLKII